MIKIYVLGGYQPSVANQGDAGIDLKYCGPHAIPIVQGIVHKLHTGMYVEIPEGKCGIIFERSGLGAKYGVNILGRIIDSGYRGEIIVILDRNSNRIYDSEKGYEEMQNLIINPGDKIAQMVITDCNPEFQMVGSKYDLSNTSRGEKGLGSSGK